MPIFDVYQINEVHLARVRVQRANSVMEDCNPEMDIPNPFSLSYKQWKKYVKETLSSKDTPSYMSTTVKHVMDM
jgi:hypothetical protein